MTKQASTILIIISLFFNSCDIEQNVKETIADASDEAATMLADSVSYSKTAFKNNVEPLLTTTDSLTNKKVKALSISINSTSNYIDSLRKVMSKFGNDVKDNQVVSDVFIIQKISDSLFNKLNRSIIIAEEAALNPSNKLAVKQIGDNMLRERHLDEFKNQYFSINSPSAVTWLLSGLEIELYKAGTTSLRTSK